MLSLQNRKSLGVEILREYSPPTTCCMSTVTCHASQVMRHKSCVTRHMSRVTCNAPLFSFLSFYLIFFLQSGGASWWRVCYQQGLPRLDCIASYHFGLARPLLVSFGQDSCRPAGEVQVHRKSCPSSWQPWGCRPGTRDCWTHRRRQRGPGWRGSYSTVTVQYGNATELWGYRTMRLQNHEATELWGYIRELLIKN